jgi:hypothetical protein
MEALLAATAGPSGGERIDAQKGGHGAVKASVQMEGEEKESADNCRGERKCRPEITDNSRC